MDFSHAIRSTGDDVKYRWGAKYHESDMESEHKFVIQSIASTNYPRGHIAATAEPRAGKHREMQRKIPIHAGGGRITGSMLCCVAALFRLFFLFFFLLGVFFGGRGRRRGS